MFTMVIVQCVAVPAGDKGQKGDSIMQKESKVLQVHCGYNRCQGVAGPRRPQGQKGDTGAHVPAGALR